MKKTAFQINSRKTSRLSAAGLRQGLRLPLAKALLPAFAAAVFAAAGQPAGAYAKHLPEAAAGAVFEKPPLPLSESLPPFGVYSLEQPLPLFLLKRGGETCALPLEQPPREVFSARQDSRPGSPAPSDFAFERLPVWPAGLADLELSQDLLQPPENFEEAGIFFKDAPLRWQKLKLCPSESACSRESCQPAPNKYAGFGAVLAAAGLIYFGGCAAAYKIRNNYIIALCSPVWQLLP